MAENKNNSSSSVNVNVTPVSHNPFSAEPRTTPTTQYNPPDFMEKVITSILTFKDDLPNLIRKSVYLLVVLLLLSNCAILTYFNYKMGDMESRIFEEVKENRSKIMMVYNKIWKNSKNAE